ncbi:hypothetical protein PanWU01x14_367970, partial [Parasponia andersonii]
MTVIVVDSAVLVLVPPCTFSFNRRRSSVWDSVLSSHQHVLPTIGELSVIGELKRVR